MENYSFSILRPSVVFDDCRNVDLQGMRKQVNMRKDVQKGKAPRVFSHAEMSLGDYTRGRSGLTKAINHGILRCNFNENYLNRRNSGDVMRNSGL